MKPSLLLALFTVFLCIPSLYAQKKLTEGTIHYDIVIDTKGGKTKGADYMDGATVVNFIKGSRIRKEMVSALGKLTTIHHPNNSKDSIVVLREFGEQKYMITMTQAEWRTANSKSEGIVYTFDSDTATRMIQNYRCKRAVGTMPNGTVYTVWYSPDLVVENKDIQFETGALPGLALEYEVNKGGEKVTYTVSSISFSPVPTSKFDLPKSGFRVLTFTEAQKMR